MRKIGLMMAAAFGVLLAVNAAVVPGAMNDASKKDQSFNECRKYAEANQIPLVLIFGTKSKGKKCEYCASLEEVLSTPEAKAWMAERGYVFCKVWGKDMDDDPAQPWNDGAKHFAATADGAKSALGRYPIVCAYWVPSGSPKIVDNFVGRGPNDGNPIGRKDFMTLAQFQEKVEAVVGDYGRSASFLVGNTVGDRLEAEATTESVDVPLVRPSGAAGRTATDRLEVVKNGAVVQSETVAWSAGETLKYVSVETKSRYAAGGSLTLNLYDGKGKLSASSAVTFVARENSPKNPTFAGVSAFGEWTMDLQAAQDYARANGGYSLALVAGGIWCPDCAKTDAYLVDTPQFKQWANEKKIACAVIDIPNWSATAPESGPCLLTREAKEVSAAYSAADPEHGTVQSGAGYLSRRSISDTMAAGKLAFNKSLAGVSTLNGGWNRPERSNQFRTGVPIFILLNGDGSIAGRFETFASVSPTEFHAEYIDRLNDLLALSGGREDGMHWMTATTDACKLMARGGSVSSAVSAVRTSAYWKLTDIGNWARGTFVLKGDRESGTPGEANVSLSVWKKVGATATKVATTEGNLFNGVTLAGVAIDVQSEWFVQVEAKVSSAAFDVLHAGDSSVGYTLSATAVDDPGSVAFTSSGTTVKEADVKKAGGFKEIRALLVRTGGAAGVKTVDVGIDPSSTAEDERYDLVDGSVTWVDGEFGEKAVRIWVYDDPNADGTQDVVLNAEGSRYTLTIIDDDKAKVGRISISDAEPSIAKSRTVIAVEGSVAGIGVSRIEGASGAVSARLVTDAGKFLDESRIEWANRESGLVWRELVLPSLAEAPKSGKVTVKLDSPEGARIDSRSKTLTIQLIAADAPKFAEERVSLTQVERYVSMRRTVGILNVAADAKKVSVKKLSGTQPSGLKASVVDGQFVLEGIPTCKAGTYAAVYQVSETVGRKTIQGLTLEVEFTVGDFSALPAEDPGANPAVAKARTIPDAIVMNARSGEIVGMICGLSINQRGKLSAKYKCKAGTISLSSSGWSDYNPLNGTLEATLTAKKTGHELKVRALSDGEIEASVCDPALPDGGLDLVVPEMWDGKVNSAEPWKGYYTVDFTPTNGWAGVSALAAKGDAIATLKMTSSSDVRKGRMKYSGVLPNGKGFSGSAVLIKTGVDTVVAPLFFLNRAEFFVATPQIAAGQPEHAVSDWPQGGAFWTHTEAKAGEGCYECAYRTAGSFYDPKADLEMLALAKGQGSAVRLFCAKPCMADEIPVVIQAKKPVIANPDAARAYKLSLRFTKSTGLISGTFKFTDALGVTKSATYKGVVMPDWDACPICGDRPWAAGAFWYSDKLWYEDARGRSRSVSVKCGDAVTVELAE